MCSGKAFHNQIIEGKNEFSQSSKFAERDVESCLLSKSLDRVEMIVSEEELRQMNLMMFDLNRVNSLDLIQWVLLFSATSSPNPLFIFQLFFI